MITKADAAKLLATCAAFDQRTTGVADVEAWHQVLNLGAARARALKEEQERLGFPDEPNPAFDLDYETAEKRIIDWYSRSRERIMPNDIIDPQVDTGDLW